MARLKKYPGVQQISDTTFKLIIVDGYTKLPNGNKKQNRFFKTVNAKSSKEVNIILKMSHVCILREPPHASTRATMFISGSHLPI